MRRNASLSIDDNKKKHISDDDNNIHIFIFLSLNKSKFLKKAFDNHAYLLIKTKVDFSLFLSLPLSLPSDTK